ncbi:MAG: YbgC/FadM family acyl-CoA thioesterase [Elusimicrobia bacterium]|nr:YbgC/FadM family acyl-CoA thioesterase [Elusimicrobiota bacterium]
MKTVLVIDDDQTLVALLKEGLESAGYGVAAAFDGVQGVLQAHQRRPDIIILDFYMPGGGGHTVYERLRGVPDTAKIPIIFSTVCGFDEVKKRIHPSAHTYFLKKPLGLNQVISAVNNILGESKASPQTLQRPEIPKTTANKPQPRGAAPAAPRFHEFDVRVTYADTDKLGIIYYANYFKYFEEGRTELLRSLGLRYRDLEIQRKLFIPAVEANCRYLAPSRYDDLLVVRTWISDLGAVSIRFENEIYDQDLGGKKVARGFSRHAVVNDLWRAARIPHDLRQLLEPYVGGPS